MVLSKVKISRFVYVRESLKEVITNSDFNEEISDCIFLKSLGIKFVFSLYKHNIITVGDLITYDQEEIFKAVNNSRIAVTRMTTGLKRLYFSYGNITASNKRNKTCIPAAPLTKTFAILNKMTKEQLAVSIDLDEANNPRLCKTLKKANIVTFQDLKDAGIVKINNLHGLGRKTFYELFSIIKDYYNYEPLTENDIIAQFRNHLIEANKEVSEEFDVKPLEEKLYGYIFEFTDSLNLGRSGEIFKLRNSLKKMTFESIGEKYGLTKERIRQIVSAVNNKVSYNFINRKKAATNSLINNFYGELCSIDKSKIMYPLYVFANKKDVMSRIIFLHFKAINFQISQIKIIKPRPAKPKIARKKRKTKIVPDDYAIRSILSVVESNEGSWTINKLTDLLRGNFDIVFDKEFSSSRKHYGLCKKYTRDYLIDSINYLLNNELLGYIGNTYKLCLTECGKMVLERLKLNN